jgi:O-antigen/teichoic acid export membrane protein
VRNIRFERPRLSYPAEGEKKPEPPEQTVDGAEFATAVMEPPSEPRPPVSDLSTTGSARRILRNVALRGLGETISKVASVVFFVVIARKLGTTDFGQFGFALSFTGAALLLAALGTDSVLAREVARDERRIHEYLGDVVVIRAAMSVVFLAVVAAAMLIGGSTMRSALVMTLVGGEVAIEGLSRAWQGAFQAYERQGFISLSLGTQRILTAIGAVAVLAYGGGLIAVSVVFVLGSVVGLAIAIWTLHRYVVHIHWHFDRARLMPLTRLGIPIGLASLLFTVLLRADVVILRLFRSSAQVGLYTSAMRLVEATMLISWFLGAAVLPWLARESSTKGPLMGRGFELGVKGTIALLMPIGVGSALYAPQIVQIVYGKQYAGAAWPLRFLGVVMVCYGINYFTAIALTAHDRPDLFNRLLPVVVVQNVATNLILIPLYGIKGASVAAASSAVLLAVLSIRLVAREFGQVRASRFLVGPLAGAVAMGAAKALVPLPLFYSLVLAAVAYLAAFALIEALVLRDELVAIARVLRKPGAPIEPPLAGAVDGSIR